MEAKNSEVSQIEITERIRNASAHIKGEGIVYIENCISFLERKLEFRELTPNNEGYERSIRWKRTAGQILEDGYVYKPKSCTDLVITLQALCETKGYKTYFVKLKGIDGEKIHSMAEVRLKDGWYLVDIGGRAGIRKGEFKKDEEYFNWKLWKRGRDSWDVGLDSYQKTSLLDSD